MYKIFQKIQFFLVNEKLLTLRNLHLEDLCVIQM